jgi:hypothetical protein
MLLDQHLYGEVIAGRGAFAQALLIVGLVAVATQVSSFDEGGLAGLKELPGAIVLGLVGWVVGTSLAYLIGTKLLATSETNASWSALAQALGFAQSPGIFRALGILPGVGLLIALVTIVWQFFTLVVALRQALHYQSHWRAVAVAAVGFVPYILIMVGLNLLVAQR